MSHDYPRLGARLFNVPLLVSPEKADTLAAVFNAYVTGAPKELPPFEPPHRVDIAAQLNMRRAEGGYYVANNGIAVVQVFGTLVQRGMGTLSALSGLEGYDTVAAKLNAAARDHGVRGIVMEFDSTGGEVEGVIEAATAIADVQKPVWAQANGVALSGAYWLAAAADRIYTTPTGLLGSIGVLIMHADRSQIVARSGVVYTPIVAGAKKAMGRPDQPLSEELRDWFQARVDDIYTMFTEHVASNRGMSVDAVKQTEAGILSANESVDIGLADGVSLLGETVQTMADAIYNGGLERKKVNRRGGTALSTGEQQMSGQQSTTTPAATNVPAAITQADLDAARAAGHAQGSKEASDATTAAVAKASADAKARIKGIIESAEGVEHPQLANRLAYDTDHTVEQAVALMKGLPKEVVAAAATTPLSTLDARMKAEAPNPKVGAGDGEGGEETAEQMGARLAGYANTHKVRLVK